MYASKAHLGFESPSLRMKLSFRYRFLRGFIRFVTNGLYYKSSKVVGIGNVPESGVSTVIVSNHYFCMNDPMAILLSLKDRKPYFIVRADVFSFTRNASNFLKDIGLLPAYRLGFDTSYSMSGNDSTFRMTEEAVLNGDTLAIFPQAGHSEGNWLDRFTGGTAKMIFEAAASSNFEKEIFIVPSCNHYSGISGIRNDMLVKFSEPLKASEFYELYKTKPQRAIRDLTELMWNRVESMMLDIRDRENYETLRFILDTEYPATLAAAKGLDWSDIEVNLKISKHIIETLYKLHREEDPFLPDVMSNRKQSVEEIKEIASDMRKRTMRNAGVDTVPGGKVTDILSLAEKLSSGEKSLSLSDRHFSRRHSYLRTSLKLILLLVLSPFAILGIWPTAVCWLIPQFLVSKAGSRLWEGTFLIALNVLFILPLCILITLLVVSAYAGFPASLIYVLLFPLILLFEWRYSRVAASVAGDFRWFRARRRGRTGTLADIRSELFSKLDEILK